MQTFEQSLADLVIRGLVDEQVAARMARVETLFTQQLNAEQRLRKSSSRNRSPENGHNSY